MKFTAGFDVLHWHYDFMCFQHCKSKACLRMILMLPFPIHYDTQLYETIKVYLRVENEKMKFCPIYSFFISFFQRWKNIKQIQHGTIQKTNQHVASNHERYLQIKKKKKMTSLYVLTDRENCTVNHVHTLSDTTLLNLRRKSFSHCRHRPSVSLLSPYNLWPQQFTDIINIWDETQALGLRSQILNAWNDAWNQLVLSRWHQISNLPRQHVSCMMLYSGG